MKNKKLTIGAFVLASLIGGGYYFKNHIETQVVTEIQNSLTQANIQYEKVDYELFKNRLELLKLSSSQTEGTDTFSFAVDRLLVHDFNRALFAQDAELPDVFGNLSAEKLALSLESSQDEELFSLLIDKLVIDEYKHNIPELVKQSEIDTNSKEFYKALLTFAHEGIAFNAIEFSYILEQRNVFNSKIASLNITQDTDYTKSSYLIKDLEAKAEEFLSLNLNQFELTELQYPQIDNIAELLVIISKDNFTYEQAMVDLPILLDKTFSYSHTKPFDTLALTALMASVNDTTLGRAKLSLANSSIELDYKENDKQREATISSKVRDLSYGSDFNEIKSPLLKKILTAFNYSTIQANMENESHYNFNTKALNTVSKTHLPKLAHIEFENNLEYSGKDFWLFALTGYPSYQSFYSSDYSTFLKDIAYKDFDIMYKDQGLIPMLIAYNALDNSITMSQSLQGITNQISYLNDMAQMGTSDLKKLSNQISTALIEQLESPDTLDLKLDFGKYVDIDTLFTSLLFTNSIDVNFNIESIKGKSVLESIPLDLQ